MPDIHVEKGSTTRLDNVGDEPGVYYYGVTARGLEFLEIFWKMKGFLAAFGP